MLDQAIYLVKDWIDDPWFIATQLAISTFILEDVSTITAAILVVENKISWELGLLAVYMGIILGDIGLYYLGYFAHYLNWAHRLIEKKGVSEAKHWLDKNIYGAVIAARFVPGLRLPTYSACGFFKLSFWKFFLATGGAGSIWTGGLFFVTIKFGEHFWQTLGIWRWVVAFIAIISIIFLPNIIKKMLKSSKDFVVNHKDDYKKIINFSHQKDKNDEIS